MPARSNPYYFILELEILDEEYKAIWEELDVLEPLGSFYVACCKLLRSAGSRRGPHY